MLLQTVRRRLFATIVVTIGSVAVGASGAMTAAQADASSSRVRWENPVVGAAIGEGLLRSATFRRLVDAVNETDGLVFVVEGKCGQGLRACLHMSVDIAGPNRLLRVFVTPNRAPGCELIGSIGHELQHALEALGNPNIRNGWQMSSFFQVVGPEGPRRFETLEAQRVQLAVEQEACD